MHAYIFLSVLSTSLSMSIIIMLLVILAPFIDRRYAAKWKYLIWILIAIRLVLPLNFSDIQTVFRNTGHKPVTETASAKNENTMPEQADATGARRIVLELPAQITNPLAQTDQTAARISILDIIMFLWAAGFLVMIAVHLGSYLGYKMQIRKKGFRIKDKYMLRILYDLTEELKIRRKIPIIEYSSAGSPMVMGFFHPVLILPAEDYSEEELFFILKHELIHLKRHDVYWKLLFIMANAVHWFNPLVWLMQKEAVVDMELSCDERVMLGADYAVRKNYTETLFSMLHKKSARKNPLSTQFLDGKRIMKKRFRNILSRSGKRNGVMILICAVIMVICLGVFIGCSVSGSDRPSQSKLNEANRQVGIVMEGIDVPDVVLQQAKDLVSQWYKDAQTDFADYAYSNWRIEQLTHCYTYDDWAGMTLQIYQLNYQFLSDEPENVTLAGGMSITEDGWVTPEYSNGRFLIFMSEETFTYLTCLAENDCYPPDAVFTEDLRNQLEADGLLMSLENETDLPEDGSTITLTYFMEGEPEEQTASLYTGSGYSIYIPDDDYVQNEPNAWCNVYNEQIRFWITSFENQDMEQVKREVEDSYGLLPDTESTRENEMAGQSGDIITRVRLFGQDDSRVWAVFYCYPLEAIEGAGARLPVIVDTFRISEQLPSIP